VKPRSLREIISGARHLLPGFDAPNSSISPETPAAAVAGQLRGILRGECPFRADIESVQDPLKVFNYIAGLSPQTADLAQRELTTLETRAAATVKPGKMRGRSHRHGRRRRESGD